MTVTFDISDDIEQQLRRDGGDPNLAAFEALLVNLYRRRRITLRRLAQTLGLSLYEADGLLKRHDVLLEISPDELRAEVEALRSLSRD